MKPAVDPERQALREAVTWQVRLRDAATADEARQGWSQWLAADPAHQRAWQRVQAVNAQLAQLPPALARQTLAPRPQASRRGVLRSLALGLGAGSTAWMGWQGLPWQQWRATHRTATGERQNITLPDGSLLALDTASGVDLDFNERERLVHLRGGRVLIATAADALGRPFSVQTPHGRVQALGTRFMVQLDGAGRSHVQVEEHAVRLLPAAGAPQQLAAGEQGWFDAARAQAPEPADPFAASWQHGGLVAVDIALGDLLAQLARYRRGHLECAPEVAQLKVSGAFPVDDTDRALAALVSRFPLQLRSRTRYWVRVEARDAAS
ncbi:FecR domain-containing protein [Comamonas antarctica]|uniref:FecR domain-containing protein n=1 Tax=Comamonas antarctica TaxID=2743470 RepID=A0A6N1XC65_9BURK|nr:FecR domain-containing protein [Comamonas antarctica]QKV55555.1 FecR domain-containing protein [Comamonas antarctica]